MEREKEMNNYIPKPDNPRPIYAQKYAAVLDLSNGKLIFTPDDNGDWEFDGNYIRVSHRGE